MNLSHIMPLPTVPEGCHLIWMPLGGQDPHAAGRQLLAQLYQTVVGSPMPAIRTTELGKPFFTDGPYHFSISHSRSHVFCCLCDRNVGIDAEEADRPVSPRLAKRYLSAPEFARWQSSGSLPTDLLRLWVLKEAYAKCTGRGIGSYLSETDFSPNDPRIQTIDGCLLAVLTD